MNAFMYIVNHIFVDYKNYLDANKENWNERTKIHITDTEYYNITKFKEGELSFQGLEYKDLDVKGKTLLHLQCHFGLDTMSWSRLGANATGVDFSDTSIELAQRLNRELDLNTEFICSDIYELPDKLDKKFDIVFTSVGVLTWLPDLKKWAKVISQFLNDGGVFYIKEIHPIAHSLGVDTNMSPHQLSVKDHYFGNEMYHFNDGMTYAGDEDLIKNKENYQWQHSMEDIIQSLLSAGLKIVEFREYPHVFYYRYGDLKMTQNKEGMWELPEYLNNKVPLSFMTKAQK